MFLKEALLLLAGLAAGSTVAAGVYAFLVVIGVYPRLIGKTATASKGKIFLYETIIALGGLFGNVVDLFTEKEYEELKKLEGHTETETFRGPVIDDLVVEIVHRVHRLDPSRMIYIVNLNHDTVENLFNDDLYWRAEPVKFCHGFPTLEQIQTAVQKQLDYLHDVPESKSKVLNIDWDPNVPDFDS